MKRTFLLPFFIVLLFFSFSACSPSKDTFNNFSHISNESIAAANGQYVFYSAYSNTDNFVSLMRSDLDGANSIELIKHIRVDFTHNGPDHFLPTNIQIVDDRVYYQTGYSLHKIKFDGSEHQEFVLRDDDTGAFLGDYFQVSGEWIYFQKQEIYEISGDVLDERYSIWKMKTDGTEEQKITDEGGRCLTVVNNHIYYLSYSPNRINHGDFILCRIGIDGSDKKVLLEDENNISSMCIAGNKIYIGRHRSNPDPDNAFTVDLNGKNKQELDFKATSMFVMEENIYFNFHYSESPAVLKKYHIPTGDISEVFHFSKEIVGENHLQSAGFGHLSIENNNIYFCTGISGYITRNGESIETAQIGIFRINKDGKDLVVLSQG